MPLASSEDAEYFRSGAFEEGLEASSPTPTPAPVASALPSTSPPVVGSLEWAVQRGALSSSALRSPNSFTFGPEPERLVPLLPPAYRDNFTVGGGAARPALPPAAYLDFDHRLSDERILVQTRVIEGKRVTVWRTQYAAFIPPKAVAFSRNTGSTVHSGVQVATSTKASRRERGFIHSAELRPSESTLISALAMESALDKVEEGYRSYCGLPNTPLRRAQTPFTHGLPVVVKKGGGPSRKPEGRNPHGCRPAKNNALSDADIVGIRAETCPSDCLTDVSGFGYVKGDGWCGWHALAAAAGLPRDVCGHKLVAWLKTTRRDVGGVHLPSVTKTLDSHQCATSDELTDVALSVGCACVFFMEDTFLKKKSTTATCGAWVASTNAPGIVNRSAHFDLVLDGLGYARDAMAGEQVGDYPIKENLHLITYRDPEPETAPRQRNIMAGQPVQPEVEVREVGVPPQQKNFFSRLLASFLFLPVLFFTTSLAFIKRQASAALRTISPFFRHLYQFGPADQTNLTGFSPADGNKVEEKGSTGLFARWGVEVGFRHANNGVSNSRAPLTHSPFLSEGAIRTSFSYTAVFPRGIRAFVQELLYQFLEFTAFWVDRCSPLGQLCLLVFTGLMLPSALGLAFAITAAIGLAPFDPFFVGPLLLLSKVLCLPDLSYVVTIYLFSVLCQVRTPVPMRSTPLWWRAALQKFWRYIIIFMMLAVALMPVPYHLHSCLPWGGAVVADSMSIGKMAVPLGDGKALIPAWPVVNWLVVIRTILLWLYYPVATVGPLFAVCLAVVIFLVARFKPHTFCFSGFYFDNRCNECCSRARTYRFYGSQFTLQSDTFCSEHRYNCLHAHRKHQAPPPVLRLALGTRGPSSDEWVTFVDERPTGVLPTVNTIKSWRPDKSAVYPVMGDFQLLVLSALCYHYDTPVKATSVKASPTGSPTMCVTAAGFKGYKTAAAVKGYTQLPKPQIRPYGSPVYAVGADLSLDSPSVVNTLGDTLIMYGLVPEGYIPTAADTAGWDASGLKPKKFTCPRELTATTFARHPPNTQQLWVEQGYTGYGRGPTTDSTSSCSPFYWRDFATTSVELNVTPSGCFLLAPASFAGARVEAADFKGLKFAHRADPAAALDSANTLKVKTVSLALSFSTETTVPPLPTSEEKSAILQYVQTGGATLAGLLSMTELQHHRAVYYPGGVTTDIHASLLKGDSLVITNSPQTGFSFAGNISSPSEVYIVAGDTVFAPALSVYVQQSLSYRLRFVVMLALLALAGVMHFSITDWVLDPGFGDFDGFYRGRHLAMTVLSGVSFLTFPLTLAINIMLWFVLSKVAGLWADLQVASGFYIMMVLLTPFPMLQSIIAALLGLAGFIGSNGVSVAALASSAFLPVGPALVVFAFQLYTRLAVFAFGITEQTFVQAASRNWYLTPAVTEMLVKACRVDVQKLTLYATTEGHAAKLAQMMLSVMCDGQSRVYRGSGLFSITEQTRVETSLSPLRSRVVVIVAGGGTGHGFVRCSVVHGDTVSYQIWTVRHAATGPAADVIVTHGGNQLTVDFIETRGELSLIKCTGRLPSGATAEQYTHDALPTGSLTADLQVGGPAIYHTLDGAFELDVARTSPPCPIGATVAGDSGSVITQKQNGILTVVGFHQGIAGPFACYVSLSGEVSPPLSAVAAITEANVPLAWVGNDCMQKTNTWMRVGFLNKHGNKEVEALRAVLGEYGERVAKQSVGLHLPEPGQLTLFSCFFAYLGLVTFQKVLRRHLPVFTHVFTCVMLQTAFNMTFTPTVALASSLVINPNPQLVVPFYVTIVMICTILTCALLLWNVTTTVTASVKTLFLSCAATLFATFWHSKFQLAIIVGTGIAQPLTWATIVLALFADLLVNRGHFWALRFVSLFLNPVLQPKPRAAISFGVMKCIPNGFELTCQTADGVKPPTPTEIVSGEVLKEQLNVENVFAAAMGDPAPSLVGTCINILVAYTGLDGKWVRPQTSEGFDDWTTEALKDAIQSAHPESKKMQRVLNRRAAFVCMMESRLSAAARQQSEGALQSETLPRVWGMVKSTLARVNSATSGPYIVADTLSNAIAEATANQKEVMDMAEIPSMGFAIVRVQDPQVPITLQADDTKRHKKTLKRSARLVGNRGVADFMMDGSCVGSTDPGAKRDDWSELKMRGSTYYIDPRYTGELATLVMQTKTDEDQDFH